MSDRYSVYAVHFADNRIKIGTTGDVPKRMSYYAQEARRNRVEHLTWWSCAPMEKWRALLVERHFCREMRDLSMVGHREWFEGDSAAFASVIGALDRLRGSVAVEGEHKADLPFLGQWGQFVTGAAA